MRISNVIIKPINTEKSVNLSKTGRFSFQVKETASKGAVANEVERVYGVNVVDVRTMIMPGNPRRLSRSSRETGRQVWKKAVVTLKEGQNIEGIYD